MVLTLHSSESWNLPQGSLSTNENNKKAKKVKRIIRSKKFDLLLYNFNFPGHY